MSITWTYEVTVDNYVKMVADNGQQSLILSWADGTPFTPETAIIWGDNNVESLNNPDCEYVIGRSPDNPVLLKSELEVAINESEVAEIEQQPAS